MANVQFFSHLVVAQNPRYKILPIRLITFRTMTHPLQCIAALQVENRLCTLQKTLLLSFLCFFFRELRDFVQQGLFSRHDHHFRPNSPFPSRGCVTKYRL